MTYNLYNVHKAKMCKGVKSGMRRRLECMNHKAGQPRYNLITEDRLRYFFNPNSHYPMFCTILQCSDEIFKHCTAVKATILHALNCIEVQMVQLRHCTIYCNLCAHDSALHLSTIAALHFIAMYCVALCAV